VFCFILAIQEFADRSTNVRLPIWLSDYVYKAGERYLKLLSVNSHYRKCARKI